MENTPKPSGRYDECIAQSNDSETKTKYLLLIAKIYYRDLEIFQNQGNMLWMPQNKTQLGRTYILIGNLYASSGPLCGTGRDGKSSCDVAGHRYVE